MCAKLTNLGLVKGFSTPISMCIWIWTSYNQCYIQYNVRLPGYQENYGEVIPCLWTFLVLFSLSLIPCFSHIYKYVFSSFLFISFLFSPLVDLHFAINFQKLSYYCTLPHPSQTPEPRFLLYKKETTQSLTIQILTKWGVEVGFNFSSSNNKLISKLEIYILT